MPKAGNSVSKKKKKGKERKNNYNMEDISPRHDNGVKKLVRKYQCF